jgi:hypothetical protein
MSEDLLVSMYVIDFKSKQLKEKVEKGELVNLQKWEQTAIDLSKVENLVIEDTINQLKSLEFKEMVIRTIMFYLGFTPIPVSPEWIWIKDVKVEEEGEEE